MAYLICGGPPRGDQSLGGTEGEKMRGWSGNESVAPLTCVVCNRGAKVKLQSALEIRLDYERKPVAKGGNGK